MKKFYALVVLLVASVTTLFAQQGPNMQAPIPADPSVRIGKLDNGLTYYIKHNAKPEKQAEFYILHNVGAIQEEDSQVGLAHFLEHMAFNGTKNFPGDALSDYLETVGVRFGYNLNAGTGQDQTIYNISSVPITREGIVDTCLLILHDWSYFVSLLGEEIDKERGVIVEELRTGNTANFRMQEKAAPTLYNGSKYAYRNIIGNEQQLRTFSHQELRDFYHRWYRTDLQAIVIVGDFDVNQMEEKVKKVMADIPAVENPVPKVLVPIPDNVEPLVCVVTDPEAPQNRVTIHCKSQPLPPVFNGLVVGEKITIAKMLIQRMTGYRLDEISQKPDAPFVAAGAYATELTATCDVFATIAISRDNETGRAFKSIYEEMERIYRFGFTDGELERVKSELLRECEQAYDNRNDRRSGELVDKYLAHYMKNAPIPTAEVEWELDSTLIVTTNIMEINAIAKELASRENMVVVVNGPEKAGITVASEEEIKGLIDEVRAADLEAYADNTVKEPLITQQLKGSAVKTTSTDKFGATVWTLGNGVRVIVKQTDFKADELLFKAAAPGGKSILTDAQCPSADLLPSLVQSSGVSKFSMIDLGKQLAGKQVQVYPTVGNYEHGFSGSSSPKDVETLLQLVYLYTMSPRWDQNDYDVMVNQYRAVLANAASNPSFIFQDSLMNTLYGHNLRRQQLSTARLDQVDFGQMPGIYTELFGSPVVGKSQNFTFTFVGNIDPQTLKPLVEKYLGSLPAGKTALAAKDDKVAPVSGPIENRFQVAMQAPKTTVRYTFTGEIPYTMENDLALDVLGQVLDIRYTASIREEKGGTYGVGVGGMLSPMAKPRYQFIVHFDTDPAMADELMEIVIKEIETIAQNGPKAEDLGKAKEYLAKQRPDDLKKNSTWLNYLHENYMYKADYNTGYDAALSGLNANQIKAIAAKILKDGNLVKIIMDPKAGE